MTRRVVCYENKHTQSMEFIEKDALQWDEDVYYVFTREDMGLEALAGTVRDIRREDDYSITAEVQLNKEYEKLEKEYSFDVLVYARNVTRKGVFPHSKVTKAYVKGFTLFWNIEPGWPR